MLSSKTTLTQSCISCSTNSTFSYLFLLKNKYQSLLWNSVISKSASKTSVRSLKMYFSLPHTFCFSRDCILTWLARGRGAMGVEETAVVEKLFRPGGASSGGTSLEHAVSSPRAVNQNQVERGSRATRAPLFFTLIKPRKGR